MKTIVNSQALEELITAYVETFNDCACCPCYPTDCDGNCEKCIDRIFQKYLKGKILADD